MILDFEDKLSSLLTLTIAKRLLQPFTFVGMLLNFWSNASEILWAGSVEIISTLSLVWASWRAILQLKKKKEKGTALLNWTAHKANFLILSVWKNSDVK